MTGSQLPSEQLIIFPVAEVSEMTVPCDKLSEIAGLQCNLVALLLVWPKEHSHIQAACPAFVTGPSLPSRDGISICGHPHPVNHIRCSPNLGLSELPWPVEAIDFHCPFPLSALSELNPWLPTQATLPFLSLISTKLFLWYPLVLGAVSEFWKKYGILELKVTFTGHLTYR